MYVKDVMTQNPVSIPSKTSIPDARKIMMDKKFHRLPVVDEGKLVGIVTEHRIDHFMPSKITSISFHETAYILAHTTVKDVMEKEVVTAHPDMTIEEAVALSQEKEVGGLPVVTESGHLVGIITSNDIFYKIVNPALGIGVAGTRLEVTGKTERNIFQDVSKVISARHTNILNLHLISSPEKGVRNLIIHLDTEDIGEIIEALMKEGYEVRVRKR
jgi:acetoin utilization protein AcuB